MDAILNILGIVSISDLDDYTPIADLIMNVHPEFNFFYYELDRFYEKNNIIRNGYRPPFWTYLGPRSSCRFWQKNIRLGQ